ncbi:MAG: hypothetical protein JXA89_26560, partial [Anaerolineae bacterium]|nr:hypothetical protein [Anaerolineae bacterium]
LTAGLALGWGLFFAIAQGGTPGPDRLLIAAAALAATALALYILGSGLARQSAWGSTIATFATIVLMIGSVIGAMLFGKAAHSERAGIPNLDIDLTPISAPPTAPLSVSVSVPAATLLQERPWLDQNWETLYWHSPAYTNRLGSATLAIPVAQTSQFFVRATTLQGQRALAQARFDVHTPLVIEAELPASLTVGDAYEIPISVNAIQPFSQTVQMTVTQAAWFRMPTRTTGNQTIDVPANERARFSVPIQVREYGAQTIEITSNTQTAGQTISRPVQVLPDGQPVIRHYNRQTNELDTYKIRIPWAAVRGTDRIAVRVYPGWSSILAEGLQTALAHRGLGEWVSRQAISPTLVSPSIPYPTPFAGDALAQLVAETNHLLLLREYLILNQKWTAHLEAQIERVLALNGQRLLTFEADRDGFSTFGQSDGDLIQTASALASLSKLETIDPHIVERIAASLLARQTSNGTWRPSELPAGWQQLPRPDLPFTAYVTWVLIDAGYGNKPGVQAAVAYLDRYQDQAQDPYTLALAVNALAAYRDAGQSSISENEALTLATARLVDMAGTQEGLAVWHDRLPTFSGALDDAADVERTALATLALLRARAESDLIVQGLALLADSRDALGTWGSPHTTYWALSAFAAALQNAPGPVLPAQEAAVKVSVGALGSDDQDVSKTIIIPAHSEGGTVYHFNFDAPAKGYNDVQIEVSGGPIFYQLIVEYVLPWNQVPPPEPEEERVSLALSYDRTAIDVGQMVVITAGINLNRPGVAPLVMVNLGLPPGVEPIMQEWQEMLETGLVAHYERTETHIRAYLTDLSSEKPANLVYRLKGKTPCAVLTQPTWALDIANPQQPTWREPVKIEIKEPQ